MIRSAITLRRAAQHTLELWLPATLAQVCVDAGLPAGRAVQPASWTQAVDVDEITARRLNDPVIAVIAPADSYDGLGRDLRATAQLRIAAVTRGNTFDDTVELNDLYRAAIAAVLHHHQDLSGAATGTEVTGALYRPLTRASRTLLIGLVDATVTVGAVVGRYAGPATPPADPLDGLEPAAGVPVDSVTVSVRPEEIS